MLKRWRWCLLCFVLLVGAAIPATLFLWPEHNRGTEEPERQYESEIPSGWKLEEIAKAASPYDKPIHTYVLAWKITEIKNSPLSVSEECLVLTHRRTKRNGEAPWVLAVLVRSPRGEDIEHGKSWHISDGWGWLPTEG